MKKYFSLTASFLMLFISCSGYSLDDTVFIPDPEDSNLPAYTEWGYNSFGAIYERDYFVSSSTVVPCKIIYNEGRLEFFLLGHLKYSGDMSLHFSFPSSPMTDWRDLLSLHGTVIDLTGDGCEVEWKHSVRPLPGSHLTFSRVQLLRVDGVENRVILSGRFDIKFLMDGQPQTLSNGRFDLGINKDFYSYSFQ
ncbi:MAG: hypothetical protein LBJ47_03455 [Tannerella sp.]|jgi:hypothetical protein|nr:hypothetical protein [Tannerella sp.]